MKEAIEKFCKARENGLFLLDMPTGFGKTYSVLEFIADNYDKEEYRGIKFFFVTTLKKNLPYNKLKEHFESRGKGDDFDRFCMQIDANADAVIENLMPLYRARKIPIGITQKPEFKELLGSVQLIVNYQDKKTNEAIANLCKNAKQAIRDTQERAFRNLVLSELARFRTPNEKLKEIANNPEYHWIGELYPAVYTREKRIYFMSMDKFILGNSTLIEPTYSFYNNKIIDKAIIFIDEFDATRDRMLNQIIKRGLDNHVDYLTLFTQVYSSLKMRSFPTELTTDSDKQKAYLEEHPRAKNCDDIISGFETVVGETYDRFSMQYSFKTADDSGRDTSRSEVMTVEEARLIEEEFYRISNPSEDQEFMYIEAMNFLIAEENNPDDMMHLGGYYYELKRFDLALKYYEMASAFGIDAADECLGYIWYYGRTGERDYEKAFKHYSKSMERGNLVCAYKVADMYKNGYYVEKDYDKYVSIIEGLYPKMQNARNLGEPLPEIYTRLARIRKEEGAIDEAIELYFIAKDFLAQRLSYNAFFGHLNIMKWMIDDLYDLIEFDEDDFDFYDMYYLLNRPSKIQFSFEGKIQSLESVLEGGAYVVHFNDKWFHDRDEFFQKACIDNERLTAIYDRLEDFEVI